MADITTDNINTIAEMASSIGDGDYIFIYKDGAQAFSKIEKSVFMQGASGGTDISDVLSNDWNDSSRQHVPSARQMNLMYNNLIMVYNGLADLLSKLANSAFSTARPTIGELDWVGNSSSYSIGYSLTHCHKTDASPTSVAEGDSFTATILPDAGYTLNGVTASGSGFGQTYDSANDKIVISASNVQNGLTITCAAVTFQVSINYTLTGFASESNTTMQSGGSFTKVLSPNYGYVVKTISITMGGTDVTSSVWTASTRTISIPVVTGNIVITATAEESTAHLITYNLTGCTKVNGADEIEEGGLTAVLAKDTSSWDGVTDFLARDIVVMMGGQTLERGVDFTATQSGTNITVSISSVTGNVEIMNVVWKNHYIFFKNYNGVSAGDDGGTNNRSAFTETYIPISANSESLAVYGYNTNDGSSTAIIEAYAWGCAVYNSGKVFTKGLFLTKDECTFDISDVNADFIRTSAWLKTTPDLNRINMCYIYDITNDKFIWYGTSVNKTSIRNNHQS